LFEVSEKTQLEGRAHLRAAVSDLLLPGHVL